MGHPRLQTANMHVARETNFKKKWLREETFYKNHFFKHFCIVYDCFY